MDLLTLKKQAEKEVVLKYDAWKDLDGAERDGLIYQEMLILLEGHEEDLLRSRLLVARDAWETKVYAGTSESFVEFLCDVGGRYRNEEGNPSGTAYDLANYIAVAWGVIEELGYHPVELAIQGWTKARTMIATVKKSVKMLDSAGAEVASPEQASSVVVEDEESIEKVIALVADEEVSSRQMMAKVQTRRVNLFKVSASLGGDGRWQMAADGLTQKQFALVQRLLERHAEIELN